MKKMSVYVLGLMLIFASLFGMFPALVPPVHAQAYQPYQSSPSTQTFNIAVTNPTNSWDKNLNTYAKFTRDAVGYVNHRNFGTPTLSPGSTTSLPAITQVDFKMKYGAEASADDAYRIIFYIGASGPYDLVSWTNAAVANDTYTLGNYATKPAGGAWTWTDIGNIEYRVEADRNGGADNAKFWLYELWVQVRVAPAALRVDPASGTETAPFSVDITVDNIVDLYGTEFQLRYDNRYLTARAWRLGNFPDPDSFIWAEKLQDNPFGNTTGRVWLSWTPPLGTQNGYSGSGTLATIYFDIVANATSTTLDLGWTRIGSPPRGVAGGLVEPLPHTITDGTRTLDVPETKLFVDPATQTVSGSFSVGLNASDVINPYEFDMRLNYTTSILTATKIRLGDYFSAGTTTTFRNTTDDTAGYIQVGIRYNTTQYASVSSLGAQYSGWTRNGTSPYLDAVDASLVTWGVDFSLYVDGFGNEKTGWTRVGTSPYLDAADYPTNYVTSVAEYEIGDFTFADKYLGVGVGVSSVKLEILCNRSFGSDDYLEAYLYDGTSWSSAYTVTPPSASLGWVTVDVTSFINEPTKVNATKMYLKKKTVIRPETITVDAARLRVLGVFQYSGNYIYTRVTDNMIGYFGFQDVSPYRKTFVGVKLEILCSRPAFSDDYLRAYLYDGTSWSGYYTITPPSPSLGWMSVDVTDFLNTPPEQYGTLNPWTKINATKMYLQKKTTGATETITVDAARLNVIHVLNGSGMSGAVAEVDFDIDASGVSPLDLGPTTLQTYTASYRTITPGATYITKQIPHTTTDGTVTTPGIHDVAVTSVVANATYVAPGEAVDVTVVVENQGGFPETFSVTAYYNETAIGTPTGVSLDPGANTTISFTWDTTGAYGNYTIKAEAIVDVDDDPADNTLTDGTVLVRIPGDIDVDGDVDKFDFGLFAGAYGSKVGEPKYIAGADLDQDGDVDKFDFGMFAGNYGSSI